MLYAKPGPQGSCPAKAIPPYARYSPGPYESEEPGTHSILLGAFKWEERLGIGRALWELGMPKETEGHSTSST